MNLLNEAASLTQSTLSSTFAAGTAVIPQSMNQSINNDFNNNNNNAYDYTLKYLMIGDSDVGKDEIFEFIDRSSILFPLNVNQQLNTTISTTQLNVTTTTTSPSTTTNTNTNTGSQGKLLN